MTGITTTRINGKPHYFNRDVGEWLPLDDYLRKIRCEKPPPNPRHLGVFESFVVSILQNVQRYAQVLLVSVNNHVLDGKQKSHP